MSMFRFPKMNRSNLEVFRFSFYLLTPIAVMFWVGIDTDKKFNVPGFWPAPETLNKIPKEPHEIQAELLRMKRADIAKRQRLEEKAKALGISLDDEEEK
ncbi:hypothetical protein BABINDRAFT_53677 [Babjeviella inositovora NRRL Y-12698]|uniref:Protein PET100, mitochondrial n=1 Tax=Babjeviella inositovora NRRL Y-12698 TaxID=984486 RepID=A0A1E3QJF6_9ASCO|nr:uncharacterized protein BABINDRAFT_53677 [Babjeviella inositovora NRRL Y-12698]ODQ77831.1 hypothetical protein BABINDRAFT_53677 [Babjeviella inositovora NRRL Y-12698]